MTRYTTYHNSGVVSRGVDAGGGDHHGSSGRVLGVARAFVVLMALGMIGLTVRVVQLQTRPLDRVARQIGSRYGRLTLQSRRGCLLDRRGRVLAASRMATRLFVDPALIEDPNTFSEQVGYGLGYDPADLERRIGSRANSRYVRIKQRLDDREVAQVQRLGLRGLSTERYPTRDYPQGPLAGQAIGFVGVDGRGLEGLERWLDGRVSGQTGWVRALRDPRRRPLWVDRDDYLPPVDGQAVRLSLDTTIQWIAETQLAQACQEYRAKSGQLIVMDPATGEILAMANYPPFDPNQFASADADARRNRCVTDVFEPGSIFKPFIWAAATDAGAATPDEKIDCSEIGVYRTPRGRVIHDAHGRGKLTWDGVLVHSSNIGMAIVAQRMEPKQLYDAVRAFGFGSATGSGLPGEVAGIVNPLKRWNHYSVTSVPMGQEIAVTAIQMVTALCAIVNDGYRPRPTILAHGGSGDAQSPPTLIYEQAVSPATAAHTRQVLRRVVTEGTGRLANSRMYAVLGKTGTAQIADRTNGGYLEDQYVASFVGAAPLNEPRLAVGCFIHRPDPAIGYYGGTVAAPAVRQVIEQSLLYMGVPPAAGENPPRAYVRVADRP